MKASEKKTGLPEIVKEEIDKLKHKHKTTLLNKDFIVSDSYLTGYIQGMAQSKKIYRGEQ